MAKLDWENLEGTQSLGDMGSDDFNVVVGAMYVPGDNIAEFKVAMDPEYSDRYHAVSGRVCTTDSTPGGALAKLMAVLTQ